MADMVSFEKYRRLYLLGELALEYAAKNEAFAARLTAALDESLAEDEERALFGLPPKRLKG